MLSLPFDKQVHASAEKLLTMTPEHFFIAACLLQAGDIYTTLRALKKGTVEAGLIQPEEV